MSWLVVSGGIAGEWGTALSKQQGANQRLAQSLRACAPCPVRTQRAGEQPPVADA
ncbi:DUF802 domain-containing protein [Serratia plymuthica]|nr:DUF802 domain-containing protein [Serratia plymuthica]